MMHNNRYISKDNRGGKQHSIIVHKKVTAKNVRLINDHWKHMSTVVRAPTVVISNSPREIIYKSRVNVPGPGHYHYQKSNRQDNYSGFKLIRFNTDTQAKQNQILQNISKRLRKNSVSVCINQSKHLIRDPFNLDGYQGITFPKETRDNLDRISNRDKSQSPGPGKYNQMHRKSSKNMFSFSKTKKFIEEEKQLSQKGSVPAPGKYQLSQSKQSLRGSKFTQAARMVTEPISTPGPGSHTLLTSSTLSHQGGTIDRQKKMSAYETGTPGPGKYEEVDINKIKTKQVTVVIGKSTASPNHKSNLLVGPGYYFREKLFKKQKIIGGTIDRSLRNSKNTEIGPGPQDYNFNIGSNKINLRKDSQKIIPRGNSKINSLIDELRLSSNPNYIPKHTKQYEREISKSTAGYY